MSKDVTTAEVAFIPECDFCSNGTPAYADAKTVYGWGYVCRGHFLSGDCQLGLGKGQKLVLVRKEYPA